MNRRGSTGIESLKPVVTEGDRQIVWVLRMVGANPVGGSGGLPGWGTILVEETTGRFETRWTSP